MTKHSFDSRDFYDIYAVTITMRDKICGGVPYDPKVIEGAIKARTGYDDHITEQQIAEAKAALPSREGYEGIVEEQTERSWNGFATDDTGLFIACRQVKACFRESATMRRIFVDNRGSKQILQHGFEIKGPVKDDRLYLDRTKADGFDEGPIHVQTAQGPRSALKRVDYCEGVTIKFDVWVMATQPGETRHLGEDEIVEMLTFAQENGLGSDRSQGRGKFDVTAFEVVQKVALKGKEKEKAAVNGKAAKKTADVTA